MPTVTMTLTGVSGGLVIAIADDVGLSSSQNEQDSRFWGRFAHVPVLEPSDSQEAHDYALVTRVEQYLGVEVISGVFYLSRIERKLGKPHQDAPARSFAEISFALAH